MSKSVIFVLGVLLFLFGLFIVCFFLFKILSEFTRKRKEVKDAFSRNALGTFLNSNARVQSKIREIGEGHKFGYLCYEVEPSLFVMIMFYLFTFLSICEFIVIVCLLFMNDTSRAMEGLAFFCLLAYFARVGYNHMKNMDFHHRGVVLKGIIENEEYEYKDVFIELIPEQQSLISIIVSLFISIPLPSSNEVNIFKFRFRNGNNIIIKATRNSEKDKKLKEIMDSLVYIEKI